MIEENNRKSRKRATLSLSLSHDQKQCGNSRDRGISCEHDGLDMCPNGKVLIFITTSLYLFPILVLKSLHINLSIHFPLLLWAYTRFYYMIFYRVYIGINRYIA